MKRSEKHEALSVFLGRWTARGTSYGGTDKSGGDPKANGEAWLSTHEGVWHTGRFFLMQDERADIAGSRFDTLSVMGVADDGNYFARSFENHGFYRNYRVEREGNVWTLTGDTERAQITFSSNHQRQDYYLGVEARRKLAPALEISHRHHSSPLRAVRNGWKTAISAQCPQWAESGRHGSCDMSVARRPGWSGKRVEWKLDGGPRPQRYVFEPVIELLPVARRSWVQAAPSSYLQRLLANRPPILVPGNEGTHHEDFWHHRFV